MTMGIIVPTAFALLCAGSIQASAALSHEHSDWVDVANQNFATIPERPTLFPSARPQPYPYNFHEKDGLSRNPNDCVVWGCVDSN